ncbi:hypothetical protein cypCar_00036065, partial [Cyprinus carpio]
VSVQCRDNPYGFNGVVVYGDESYGMTLGYIPDMTGYNQYLTRRGNDFSAGVVNADDLNDAQSSPQMLPVNVSVTISGMTAPMNTRNQLGARHMDPYFTYGNALAPVYGWGGNRYQLWDRDEQHEEEERDSRLKGKKKKAERRRRKRSRHAGH